MRQPLLRWLDQVLERYPRLEVALRWALWLLLVAGAINYGTHFLGR